MSIIVEIEGRKALVVWTLPYATSWRLSPDMLLERLTSHSSIFPTAFNLDIHNRPSPLPPAQWDELYSLVQKIERDLTAKNLSEHDDRAEWLKRSIEEFWRNEPCYVWLDEFEKWYYEQFMKNYYVHEKGEDIKLSFNPNLPKKHAQYFKDTELMELIHKAPLDKIDKELQVAQVIAYGAPTISLWQFIDRLLVEATGDCKTLSSFYDLVKLYGLDVYDKVIDGKLVSSSELLDALRQRERQADKSFDDYSFQFWETLTRESKYSILRDDVAMAYGEAGKLLFPWFNMYGGLVWLNTGEPTIAKTMMNDSMDKQIASVPVEHKQVTTTDLMPEAAINTTLPTDDGDDTATKERGRAHTKWFRLTWIAEGKPSGKTFFNRLKQFKNQKGSPIIDWYEWPQPGIIIKTATGRTVPIKRKRIENMPGEFTNALEKTVSSDK